MIKRKTWDEFRNAQLLWWVNRMLHLFGWVIVVDVDENGEVKEAYPAKTKFRGFEQDCESEGFAGLSEHLKNNIEEIANDAKI